MTITSAQYHDMITKFVMQKLGDIDQPYLCKMCHEKFDNRMRMCTESQGGRLLICINNSILRNL